MRTTLLLLLSIWIGHAANGQLVEDTITSPVFVTPTPRDNFFGVHVTHMGVMGQQPNIISNPGMSYYNRWIGSYTSNNTSVSYIHPSGNAIQVTASAAWNANVEQDPNTGVWFPSLTMLEQSTITVPNNANCSNCSYLPPHAVPDPSTVFGAAWIKGILPTNQDIGCNNVASMAIQPASNTLSNIALAVVNKVYEPAMYYGVNKWWAEKDVYALLEKNPDLIANNSAAHAFYDSVEATPLRQFTEADKALYTMHRLPAGAWQPLHDWEAQKTWLQNDMAHTDSLLHTEGADTLSLLLHRQQLLQQALEADSAMAAYHLQLKQDEAQKEQQAYSKVGLLPQRTYYEEFKKETAEGRLRLRGAAEALWLDTLRLEKLRYIARQCFLAAGDAVFEARALLAAHEPQSYDDFDICMEQGIVFKMEPPGNQSEDTLINLQPRFLLYPNPASAQLNIIKLSAAFETGTRIAVWDIQGRKVHEHTMADHKTRHVVLNTTHLVNGSYLLKLYEGDVCTYQDKFNVLK